jgi:replicative DNA helicase
MSTPAPYLRTVSGDDRPMPASPDAERAAIGCVLLKEELLPDLEDLFVDDFFLPAHREIWEAVRALNGRQQKLDIIAVQEEIRSRGSIGKLEGGGDYLVECAGFTPHAENAGFYANHIREKAALRRAYKLCSEVQSMILGGGGIDPVRALARAGVNDLENTGIGQGPVRVGDEIPAALAMIEAKAKNPTSYSVSTGIRRYDRKIGLRPEQLIVVAAPPSYGKSAWATGVAAHNALRLHVPSFILSVEMSRQELIERFLASEASVPNGEIGSGEALLTIDRRNAIWEAGAKIAEADVPLYVDDRESLTIGQAVGTIRRWYAQHLGPVPPKGQAPKPAFIAVDYLQLLESDAPEDDENRNQAVATMTRAFKRLAKSLRVPLVLLCQLSRAWTKRGGKPQLSDLRDSGAIEQDADQVIFPWREPQKDEQGRELRGKSGPAEWIVGKNRGGLTGTIPVWWEAPYTRFDNLDDSQAREI